MIYLLKDTHFILNYRKSITYRNFHKITLCDNYFWES